MSDNLTPTQRLNEECHSCLEVKPILYLTRYETCYGDGDAYECSCCRMMHNLNDNPNYRILELKP